MKLDTRRSAALLADPGQFRAALFHGEDHSLARERAHRLIATIAGKVDDPFRVVALGRDAWPSLPAELGSRSLTGGRRAIHVSDATDALVPLIEQGLRQAAEAFLVVESGALTVRSKLRQLFEGSTDLAAVVCHPLEVSDAGAAFAEALRRRGIALDAEALDWVASRITPERATLEGEAERLAIFVHPERSVSLDDVQACLGAGPSGRTNEAVLLALGGDAAGADGALDALLLDGTNPVTVAIAANTVLARLHRARMLMLDGLSAGDAVKSLRPPVFFREQAQFARVLVRWSPARVASSAAMVAGVEFACKQTGAPADVLVRRALLQLAVRASSGVRRSGE